LAFSSCPSASIFASSERTDLEMGVWSRRLGDAKGLGHRLEDIALVTHVSRVDASPGRHPAELDGLRQEAAGVPSPRTAQGPAGMASATRAIFRAPPGGIPVPLAHGDGADSAVADKVQY
jgi:hypothetical protein